VLDSVAQRPESPPFSAAINMVLLSVPQRQPVCAKVSVKKCKRKFRIVTRGDRDFGY
jgi:hypothetical protein